MVFTLFPEKICHKVVESGVLEACFPLLYSENVDVQEKVHLIVVLLNSNLFIGPVGIQQYSAER
jgi:hypothetical protein